MPARRRRSSKGARRTLSLPPLRIVSWRISRSPAVSRTSCTWECPSVAQALDRKYGITCQPFYYDNALATRQKVDEEGRRAAPEPVRLELARFEEKEDVERVVATAVLFCPRKPFINAMLDAGPLRILVVSVRYLV